MREFTNCEQKSSPFNTRVKWIWLDEQEANICVTTQTQKCIDDEACHHNLNKIGGEPYNFRFKYFKSFNTSS